MRKCMAYHFTRIMELNRSNDKKGLYVSDIYNFSLTEPTIGKSMSS